VCIFYITMAKKTNNKYRVRSVRTTKGGFEMFPKPQPVNEPTATSQEPTKPPVVAQPVPVSTSSNPSQTVSNPEEKKPWWKFWAGKRSSKRTMKKRCYKNKTSKQSGKSRRSRK